MKSDFAYCACQPGAEPALKAEVAARLPAWRFAFSRPGFVTFKLPSATTPDRFEPMRLTFARTIGLSYGKIDAPGSDPTALADEVWRHEAARGLADNHAPLALHVWTRDKALPGDDGAEPGPNPTSLAAVEALTSAAPEGALADRSSDDAKKPRVVLDAAIVEPTEWWVGAHTPRSRTDRWPGGAPRLELPGHAVSRAYLKMQEALRWSGAPVKKGDVWVELGCAPGGASQALLDAGMGVVGVDPADVDPIVAADPGFEHLRCRAAEVGVDEVTDASWLAADLNVAPAYTLDAVERLATHRSIRLRGLLLTLKLPSPELASPEEVAAAIGRVRSWGFADVRTRQLAHNRREYCLAAVRSRGQRRVARRRRVSRRRPRPT